MDNPGEFLHLLSNRKREELVLIDEALERLKEGTYGHCQECEKPVEVKRLQVCPFARFWTVWHVKKEKKESFREMIFNEKVNRKRAFRFC